nr:hypothetical protein [Fredinandcohnia onubensis]
MNPFVGLDVSKGESQVQEFYIKANLTVEVLKFLMLWRVLVHLFHLLMK